MVKDLENLIELQNIDLRVQELEQSKEDFPREVEELERRIEEAGQATRNLQEKLDSARTERQNAADEIENARQSLEKSQERLSMITTNREYDAVHAEIEANKQILANSENRMKNYSENIERLESELEESRKQEEEIRTESEPKLNELREKIASIDSTIAEAVKEREKVLPDIGRPFLRPYEHIHSRRKSGRVLSMVNANEGTCTICFKVLERQLVNEVKRGDKLTICQSCGSLLVWNPENEPKQEQQEDE
jgi:hypothetical protein